MLDKLTTKDLVDTYVELDRKVAELAPTFERLKEAKAEILRRAEAELAADQEGTLDGERHAVKVGKKANCKTVKNKPLMFTLLEQRRQGLLQELAKVDMKDIQAWLTPEELSQVIEEERTGSRTLKVLR